MTTAIEDAIHGWVVASSGLTADKIVWDQQSARAPAVPYIELRLTELARPGQGQINRTYDAAGDPGEEIVYHARDDVTLGLRITCYGATVLGTAAPKAIVSKVRAYGKLVTTVDGTVRDAFVAATLSAPVGFSAIQVVPGIVAAQTEPRAFCTCRLFATDATSALGTFVETVEIDGESGGDLENISIAGPP